MLVIERTTNGRTMVTFKKDWHHGRLSSEYTPPKRNYIDGYNMERVQRALLKPPVSVLTPWWAGK